jgi:hypothetical protein
VSGVDVSLEGQSEAAIIGSSYHRIIIMSSSYRVIIIAAPSGDARRVRAWGTVLIAL